MDREFHQILSDLRRRSGKNQRKVAADLGISQALLSHYETGAREPGLAFVCRACDYYGVSADYLLGRSAGDTVSADDVKALADAMDALTRRARGLVDGPEKAPRRKTATRGDIA